MLPKQCAVFEDRSAAGLKRCGSGGEELGQINFRINLHRDLSFLNTIDGIALMKHDF